jgi:hypothetical protein
LSCKKVLITIWAYVISEPITTNVVSLNPAHGKVYSIQHYVIKFVSDLRRVSGFSSTNKADCHHIAEILLKWELNTITLSAVEIKCCEILLMNWAH